MRNLLTLLFIQLLGLITSTAFCQVLIVGEIKDQKKEPLPYANIGIKGGKLGAVSTLDGKFSISIPDSLRNDTLTFRSIGFKDKSYVINTLLNKKDLEVILEDKVTSLAEVRITNTKLKQYKLGITGRTPMISIPGRSYQKNDVLEQARILHLKKPAKIINANIFLLSQSKKEVSVRLNFYAVENGMPGKRLVEKSIIRKSILDKGWFRIDLKDEDIFLDEDFVVSFEFLPSTQQAIFFAAKIGAADSFLRSSSLGVWRKNAVGGCSIFVTAER